MEEKLLKIEKIVEEWQMGLHSSEAMDKLSADAMSKIEKVIYPQLEKPDYNKIAKEAAKNT